MSNTGLGPLKEAVKEFYSLDRGLLFYLGTALLLAVALFINYSPYLDVQWVTNADDMVSWSVHYLLLFGGIYYASAMLGAFGRGKNYLKDPLFWVLSGLFIAIAIIPKIHALPLVSSKDHPAWTLAERVFVSRSHFFLHQFLLTSVVLSVFGILISRWIRLDFGLRWNFTQMRTYLLILALIGPVVIAASFLHDFQNAYPQYKPWLMDDDAFGMSNQLRSVVFTLCYSSGFVAVELLFRGALAIAMFQIMGTRAVLPMAAFYCAFHFGKPMGEAIASIFGGYLLGVLAIHGRSISGGIIVHLGVAMLMELTGHLHHTFR